MLLHKEMVKRTREITNKSILYNDTDMALKFLREWWLGHIKKEDKKYTPYVKKYVAME